MAHTDSTFLAVSTGSYYNPHSLLGIHPLSNESSQYTWIIRVLRPLAQQVHIIDAQGSIFTCEHARYGIWECFLPQHIPSYIIKTYYEDGSIWEAEDPYRFPVTISPFDLYLLDQGRHENIWNVLGAHVKSHEGVNGVAFSVWAPHATAVQVVSDFNAWNGTQYALRSLGHSGIWELFVPQLHPNLLYKFRIKTQEGNWIEKSDPFAQQTQVRPETASCITQSSYRWSDQEWMIKRSCTNPHTQPMSIYEIHLGSWKPGNTYRTIAPLLIEHIQKTGFTHVEFMPIMEHPLDASWGYQTTGYYAPTSRFGTPDDLRYLIDELHKANIGVFLDWVPAHFPKDEWALARFDGQPLYEHSDPFKGEHPDWGTYIFDYANPQVKNFLIGNALYWLEEFHIDGLRVDAVASLLYLDYSRTAGNWSPNIFGGNQHLEALDFLRELTSLAYRKYPGIIMMAEESTSWPGVTATTENGGLGFGAKWNMGWMNDTLKYLAENPLWRSDHHDNITFSFLYAWNENYILPISHDEVVHGKQSLVSKMPGSWYEQRANVRAYLAFMWSHPGKKLLFMGQELGQPTEWHEDKGVDWDALWMEENRSQLSLVSELNRLYCSLTPLWELDQNPNGFAWILSDNKANLLAFMRKDSLGTILVVIVNFSGIAHENIRIGFPGTGTWNEILNTDSHLFGGSDKGNCGSVFAEHRAWNGQPSSAEVTLAPLSCQWFTQSNYKNNYSIQ